MSQIFQKDQVFDIVDTLVRPTLLNPDPNVIQKISYLSDLVYRVMLSSFTVLHLLSLTLSDGTTFLVLDLRCNQYSLDFALRSSGST